MAPSLPTLIYLRSITRRRSLMALSLFVQMSEEHHDKESFDWEECWNKVSNLASLTRTELCDMLHAKSDNTNNVKNSTDSFNDPLVSAHVDTSPTAAPVAPDES
jgi:hypothetical protein